MVGWNTRLTKFEQQIRASIWTILLSDCRSLSYARRMRDTSSKLFQAACFLSSFANVVFGFCPGNYVGLSDALSRQYANSTIINVLPVKELSRMPPILPSAPGQFTHADIQQIFWTGLHSGDLIDCSLKGTLLTNPPVSLDTCLHQIMESSPIGGTPVSQHTN